MKKLTEFQRKYQNPTNEFEIFQAPDHMKYWLDLLLHDVNTNKDEIMSHRDNRKVMYDDYAHQMANANRLDPLYPSEETLQEWMFDEEWTCYSDANQTIIPREHVPKITRDGLNAAFKKEFPVFEGMLRWSLYILMPGDIIAIHYDSHDTKTDAVVKYPDKKFNEKRLLVYLDDQYPGQSSWAKDGFVKTKKHDILKFELCELYHGAANIGWDWRPIIIITYVEEAFDENFFKRWLRKYLTK